MPAGHLLRSSLELESAWQIMAVARLQRGAVEGEEVVYVDDGPLKRVPVAVSGSPCGSMVSINIVSDLSLR